MDSWIKLSWSDGTDITQASYTGTFIVDVSDMVVNDAPVIQRAVESINQIVKNNPPPYRLFVSGGIDSQAMLYAWKKSGHEFEAHSFVYDQNMNVHDLAILWEFAKTHNIKLRHHDISHFDFLKTDLKDYSKKYNCNSPQITFYISMMDRFSDGTIVLSGNPPVSVPWFNFTILALERYRIISGKPIVPFFWINSPELAGAWAYRLQLLEYQKNKHPGIISSQDTRVLLYLGSTIPIIDTYKKSGFEKYKLYFDNYPIDQRLKVKLMLNKNNYNKSRRAYDFLFRFTLIDENPISPSLRMIGIQQ